MTQAQLNNMDLPVWGTNVGVCLEPSNTIKARGWLLGKKPPARWQNWYQNSVYNWTKKLAANALGSWDVLDLALSNLYYMRKIVYNPVLKFWQVHSSTHRAVSLDGLYWTTPSALGGSGGFGVGITGTQSIIGRTDGYIEYTTDGYTYIAQDTGKASPINTIVTNYPGNKVAVIYDDSLVKISSTGGGGSWTAATASPSGVGSTDVLAGCYLYDGAYGSVYMIGQWGNGKTWISPDSGDNWTVTSDTPSSLGMLYIGALGYNPTTHRLIAVGADTGSANMVIATSLDYGANWDPCPIPTMPVGTTSGNLWSVHYCGGTLWIAFGYRYNHTASGAKGFGVLLSQDDGLTWTMMPIPGMLTTDRTYGIGCDGKKLVAPLFQASSSRILIAQASI